MSRIAQLRPGLPPTDYYAPNYRVEVEGQELDPETKGDVLDVKVVMDIENITSFDITFNNWDDRHLDFKYSDTKRLDVGTRVEIHLGYADRLVSMVKGMITGLTPRFPESGPPTIGVSGHDLLFCLKDRKPKEGEATQFVDKTDWEIAQVVAQRNKLNAIVTEQGPRHKVVVQKNQDDAQFLMERAKRIDFDLFVQTDPDSDEDALYFVKPKDGRDDRPIREYEFEWGKTLIEFTPTLSLAGQVGSLTVRGWDPRTKQAIVATADAKDLPPGEGGGESGPTAIDRCLGEGNKQDRVVDAPVTTEQEAKELAVSLLREKAYEFITGSGRVIGLPDLRPGDNLSLVGLGRRFSGRYYIKKVEHSLGSSGYLSTFEVRKFVDGGTR